MNGPTHGQPVPDPYLVLGLERSATLAQIRSAHRRLAKTSHPDLAGGDAARFLAVQAAYQILTGPGAQPGYGQPPSRADASAGAGPPKEGPANARAKAPGITFNENPDDEGYPYRTVSGAAWSLAGRARIRRS
jgi:DnaJ-class molecular chaperone